MLLRRFLSLDFILLFSVFVLFGLGLTVLYSMFGTNDSVTLVIRQGVFITVTVIMMIFIGVSNYDYLRTYSKWFYVVAFFVMLYAILFGVTVNGTAGWIDLGITNVQPVEFAKVTLIIFLAHFISHKRSEIGEVPMIVGSFVIMAIFAGLTLRQPDTGSAMVVVAIWFGMVVASGIKKRYLFGFVVAGAVLAAMSWSLLAPYQQARITNFLNPENDPQNTGYNVIQSMIAIGNGGLSGRGVGYGTQSQLNFLPEKHTDFIFASFVEALGFIGAFFLLLLFFIIFVRLRSIALYARDAFGYFLTVGVAMLLFTHMTVNVAMNMGVFPVTGIPLPFVSYGGSAIVSMGIAIGIILSIHRHRQRVLSHKIQESY